MEQGCPTISTRPQDDAKFIAMSSTGDRQACAPHLTVIKEGQKAYYADPPSRVIA